MGEKAQVKGDSATVTVASKLPYSIVLRLDTMVPKTEAVLGGGMRETNEAMKLEEVTILGYAAPFGETPKAEVIGGKTGYALTHGVKREFFERWLEQHADMELVKRGLIFATDTRANAVAKAREMKGEQNGLEPLDPKNLPKLSKNLRVETATKEEAA